MAKYAGDPRIRGFLFSRLSPGSASHFFYAPPPRPRGRPLSQRSVIFQTQASDVKSRSVVNQRAWVFLYERLIREVRGAVPAVVTAAAKSTVLRSIGVNIKLQR